MSESYPMPAIPMANIPFRSPPRPTPKFFADEKTFSTKKERDATPRASYPRPPIKSCPPVSRVFHHSHLTDKPRIVSFKSSSESLCSSYNQNLHQSYFQQCFIIEKKLGAGSFGDVYKVRSKEDGKMYAVKRSRERYRGDIDRKRKLEEVSKHELLPSHPNCIQFHKAWEEKQRFYIQTELCETSLDNLSEQEHDIPERLIWGYLIDLLRAVKHLHTHDLIHMDIKPENIFITKDGTCKLGDFGLILDLSKSDLSEAQEGDPKYLAPELLRGKFTKAADIFSLGITVLELACDLDLPRGDVGWHQLRSGHLPDDIIKGKLSANLREIILLMMSPDPLERPSADTLLSHTIIRRSVRYGKIHAAITQSFQQLVRPLLSFWLYLCMLWWMLWPRQQPSPVAHHANGSGHVADITDGNHSWDSSLSEEDVFHDDLLCSRSNIDFSTDSSSDSLDYTDRYNNITNGFSNKAFTTGAKRRPVRTARLLGVNDSPIKTPSHGSPRLPSSRSSTDCALPPKEPSSTTPPSCRKLFHEEPFKNPPIGPKNLMSAFDNAESDED